MKTNLSRFISISLFLSGMIFVPGQSEELKLKNNSFQNKISKINNISCTDEQNIIQDLERSFDHENRTLINRVNEKNNIKDFFGIGPNRYPENRMVQESKKMWDTFECHMSKISERFKPMTKDIFNGYNSSLSELDEI